MAPETLPPYRRISSRPISLADASKMLDKYIKNSERHPHLQPDAIITPSGVTFSSNGGPMGGVVMHNLRRVAAGMRGEYLEPEATPEPEEQEQDFGKKSFKGSGAKGANGASTEQSEWQDMSEFEREEGQIEIGEIGDRTNVVEEGGVIPEVEVVAGVEQDGVKRKNGGEGVVMDKEARKKAKKARNKESQRQKEEARAGKAK